MPVRVMTVDELVASLRRTTLPTVLVEGRDDMTVYRWIEDILGAVQANILPCGGRDTLLRVHERRAEFSHLDHVFLADRDMWLFASVPQKHNGVVFTSGFSIENDLLDCPPVRNLLSNEEQTEFNKLANELSRWFAFEVEEYRAGRVYKVNVHPNWLVPLGMYCLQTAALAPRNFCEPNKRLVGSIRNRFGLKFRGKCLLQLYTRILSAPARTSKFSEANLLEIGTRCATSPHVLRLLRKIKNKMQKGDQRRTKKQVV